MSKMRYEKVIVWFLVFVMWEIAGAFTQEQRSETITLTTYYPSPYGVYKEIRSIRMAIGDTFYNGADYC